MELVVNGFVIHFTFFLHFFKFRRPFQTLISKYARF